MSHWYGVLEINQASRQPDSVELAWDEQQARELAAQRQLEADRIGRRERYIVVEIAAVDDDD